MPHTVLIIEDDRQPQVLLKTALEAKGYRVVAALDAMQGTMQARQEHPDVVILDIGLPAGGGYAVLDRMQSFMNTFDAPVLVYTGQPFEELARRLKVPFRHELLKKPASAQQVLEAIERLLKPAAP